MRINTKTHLMLLALLAMGIAGFFTACEIEETNDGPQEATEDVVNPTKIVHYDGSTQFVNDLETLIDYSCAVYAMRVAYYNIVSNDFKTGEAFVATENDINANTTSIYTFYDIAATITAKAQKYEDAFDRMEQEGVLEKANAARETRGFLSDTFSFIFGLKKSQEVGRKSVLAVISQSGWQNNDRRLQELFNQVAPGRREGYTNARQFWADFSEGKLDAKSNQIFQDLYHGDAQNFGLNARDLGFSPTGNMTKTAAELIEKGISVVIDAAPGGMAGAMTMGKDLYNTYEATEDVVKHSVKGTLTKEECQRLIKQWASNCINYNDKILNNIDGGKWDATIDMWDTPGNFLGQEFANIILNDAEGFSEDVFRASFGTWLDEEAITVNDRNGNPIDVVIVQDEDGKVRVSVKRTDDGSHKVKSDKKKKKTVTAADKKGHRKTKNVKAGEKEVEVDLTKVEEENDEPKDGYIKYSPSSFTFAPEGGTQRIKLTTNYLYYGVTTSVDDGYWLEATPVQGTDEFIITAQPNNSGEDRVGKVIVKATNKKGKVLKWITITASQKTAEQGVVVKATPATLEFGAEGGTQQSALTIEGFKYYGGILDDSAEGWVTLSVGDDLMFTITVAPNNTGQERIGKVIAYGCNVPEPKYNEITTATILVKQAAAAAASNYDISKVTLTYRCPIDWYGSVDIFGDEWSGYYGLGDITVEDVTAVLNGDRITVTGRKKVTDEITYDNHGKESLKWSTDENITFEIANYDGTFNHCKIENIKSSIIRRSVNLQDGGWGAAQVFFTASNVPYAHKYDKKYEFYSMLGKGVTGITLTGYSEADPAGSDYWKHNITLLDTSNQNDCYVKVEIYLP